MSDIRGVLLRIDISLLKEIDICAKKRGMTRTAFIRKGLERLVEGERLRAGA